VNFAPQMLSGRAIDSAASTHRESESAATRQQSPGPFYYLASSHT
jgi:hypothetical protein